MISNIKTGSDFKYYQEKQLNLYGCTIGNNCSVGAFTEIGPAKIGNNVKIGAFCFIPEGVTIQDNVFISPRVTFCNDKYPPSNGAWRKGKKTIVCDGVSIGAGAIILPGLVLGENCKIGAGAVVTKDVPCGTTVAGNPASLG